MTKLLVIGLDRFGLTCVKRSIEKNLPVITVDLDKEKIEKLANTIEGKVDWLVLDATNLDQLKDRINGKSIDYGIVTVRKDFGQTAIICKNLKKIGIKKVMVIEPETEEQTEILLDEKLEEDDIISLEKEAAKQLIDRVIRPGVVKHIEIEDFNLSEITVPPKLVGKNLYELGLRENYDIVILRVRRERDGKIHTHRPAFNAEIQEDDVLIVEGDPENIARLEKDFSKQIPPNKNNSKKEPDKKEA